MQALDQAARAADAGGHPLPVAWPSLAEQGVDIRGSELTVVAGQPGCGKLCGTVEPELQPRVRLTCTCLDVEDDCLPGRCCKQPVDIPLHWHATQVHVSGCEVGAVWAKVAGKASAGDGVILMSPKTLVLLLKQAGY